MMDQNSSHRKPDSSVCTNFLCSYPLGFLPQLVELSISRDLQGKHASAEIRTKHKTLRLPVGERCWEINHVAGPSPSSIKRRYTGQLFLIHLTARNRSLSDPKCRFSALSCSPTPRCSLPSVRLLEINDQKEVQGKKDA